MALNPKEIQQVIDILRGAVERLDAANVNVLRQSPEPIGYNPTRDVIEHLTRVDQALSEARNLFDALFVLPVPLSVESRGGYASQSEPPYPSSR